MNKIDDQKTQDLRKQIIRYWNNAGLCSFNSSTSKSDPYISSCNNFSESKFLEEIVKNREKKAKQEKPVFGIDIGAGLGRFTIILARHLDNVIALEPAKNLYCQLANNCAVFRNVKTFNIDFESFNAKENYDLAVVSGLLYLYPDNMVRAFFEKLDNNLITGSIIVIRDFIIQNGIKQVSSSYIEGSLCYYRDFNYWENIAKCFSYDIIEVFQSKPSYSSNILLSIFHILGLTMIFDFNVIKKHFYKELTIKKKGRIIDFSSEIQTVFIVMRK